MKAFGLDEAALLRAAGLPRRALERGDNILPLDRCGRLVELCVRRTGRPDFPLLIGQHAEPEQYGLIGAQMKHARTVGAAWRGLILNLHLNGRAVVPSLAFAGQEAEIAFALAGGEIEGYDNVLAITLAAACAVMRGLTTPRWAPSEVLVSLRRPADAAPWRRFFRAPVRFGADRSALVFPAAILQRPVHGADAGTRRRLEEAIVEALDRQDLDLVTRVRRGLLTQVSRDDISIEAMARLLGLHKRTLNRRLAASGTSFARLLGEVRFQIARHLLVETELSFVDIAATLGYGDASTFSRAFRGWAGASPSAWRRANTT
jgi:AraC-like DNA-binding protein